MRRLFPLILAIGLCVPSVAFAQFNATRHIDIGVEFDELFLGTYDGELSLEYTIDVQSWNSLQRHGVVPTIDIYASANVCDGQPIYENVELYERSDIFILDHQDFQRSDTVRVRFSQSMYRSQGTTVRLSGSLTQTWEVSRSHSASYSRSQTSRSRSHRDHSRSSRSNRSGNERSHRQRNGASCSGRHDCTDSGGAHGDIQAQLVTACAANATFEDDRRQCVQQAQRLHHSDAISVIEACGQQTSFSSDFGACMQKATTFRTCPASAIHACGEATSFSSDFAACLDSAASYRSDPSPVIRSCGNASTFSSSVAGCVADARR